MLKAQSIIFFKGLHLRGYFIRVINISIGSMVVISSIQLSHFVFFCRLSLLLSTLSATAGSIIACCVPIAFVIMLYVAQIKVFHHQSVLT